MSLGFTIVEKGGSGDVLFSVCSLFGVHIDSDDNNTYHSLTELFFCSSVFFYRRCELIFPSIVVASGGR